MASPNLNLRDPVLYRILRATHHRTGDQWCIYPLYDFAHGQCDSIEGITHSICTLEFENHRPLYDWFIEQLGIPHPKQIEMARLNITYTLMSKRKLLRLVEENVVRGWDDPRMPTLSGLRRRGYTPQSIRNFCRDIGVARFNSVVDRVVLENAIRDDLNKRAPRALAVLRPLRLVIENYPADRTELVEAVNNPEDPSQGKRGVRFGRELFIERDDFRENPPPDFHRLAPGQETSSAARACRRIQTPARFWKCAASTIPTPAAAAALPAARSRAPSIGFMPMTPRTRKYGSTIPCS
jgi:glutaminyl-tRNA synthetase